MLHSMGVDTFPIIRFCAGLIWKSRFGIGGKALEKQIGIILLAAGSSKRYGGIKLLDTIEGKKMYLPIMEKIVNITHKTLGQKTQGYGIPIQAVVTQYEEIARKAAENGFETVMNPFPERGISFSIKLGMEKVLGQFKDLDGVMFCVCDQPYLTEGTVAALLEGFVHSKKGMAFLSYGDRMGNPGIFSKKYFNELRSLEGDRGGKKIACMYPEDILLVPVKDKRELEDIDIKTGAVPS